MSTGNSLGQAQAKSGPTGCPALVASKKPVENFWQITDIDANTTVL